MTGDRHLDWEGCHNVRDLGGLRAANGRETRWSAVVRADTVDRLTATGWSAVQAHGIRISIDLRNDHELRPDIAPRPAALVILHLPLDDVEDTGFGNYWGQQAPPLYYLPHLDRFPQRAARVVSAIADARPGGVLVHCVAGHDAPGSSRCCCSRLSVSQRKKSQPTTH
jgi:protein-tyrosine phosphatase